MAVASIRRVVVGCLLLLLTLISTATGDLSGAQAGMVSVALHGAQAHHAYSYDGIQQLPRPASSASVMAADRVSAGASALAVPNGTPSLSSRRVVAAEAGAGADRIVLGHYPEYVQLGDKLGARTFSMPTEVFDAMSPEEQWAANQAFLDDAISQGSEIHLATPANAAREGSFYERELQYMQSRGYSVSSDGTMLVPGR